MARAWERPFNFFKQPLPKIRSQSHRQEQRVFDIDAQVSDRIFYFGTTMQDLDGSDVPGRSIDHRGLGSTKRVRAVFGLPEAYGCDQAG